MNIFISFPGSDERLVPPVNRKIEDCCSKQKIDHSIYYAPDSNCLADDWHHRILSEIKKANIVIIFWSKNSPSSMGQLIEIGAAWGLERNIFAILYETSYVNLPKMVINQSQSISYEKFMSTEIDFTLWL